jgi:hypothetical protein
MVVKLLKWIILSGLFIIGAMSLHYIHYTGSVKPLMATILSFGVIFIVYRQGEANKGTFLTSLFALVAALGCAYYLYWDIPILTVNIFLSWWVYSLAIGIPLMSWAYSKFDD